MEKVTPMKVTWKQQQEAAEQIKKLRLESEQARLDVQFQSQLLKEAEAIRIRRAEEEKVYVRPPMRLTVDVQPSYRQMCELFENKDELTVTGKPEEHSVSWLLHISVQDRMKAYQEKCEELQREHGKMEDELHDVKQRNTFLQAQHRETLESHQNLASRIEQLLILNNDVRRERDQQANEVVRYKDELAQYIDKAQHQAQALTQTTAKIEELHVQLMVKDKNIEILTSTRSELQQENKELQAKLQLSMREHARAMAKATMAKGIGAIQSAVKTTKLMQAEESIANFTIDGGEANHYEELAKIAAEQRASNVKSLTERIEMLEATIMGMEDERANVVLSGGGNALSRGMSSVNLSSIYKKDAAAVQHTVAEFALKQLPPEIATCPFKKDSPFVPTFSTFTESVKGMHESMHLTLTTFEKFENTFRESLSLGELRDRWKKILPEWKHLCYSYANSSVQSLANMYVSLERTERTASAKILREVRREMDVQKVNVSHTSVQTVPIEFKPKKVPTAFAECQCELLVTPPTTGTDVSLKPPLPPADGKPLHRRRSSRKDSTTDTPPINSITPSNLRPISVSRNASTVAEHTSDVRETFTPTQKPRPSGFDAACTAQRKMTPSSRGTLEMSTDEIQMMQTSSNPSKNAKSVIPVETVDIPMMINPSGGFTSDRLPIPNIKPSRRTSSSNAAVPEEDRNISTQKDLHAPSRGGASGDVDKKPRRASVIASSQSDNNRASQQRRVSDVKSNEVDNEDSDVSFAAQLASSLKRVKTAAMGVQTDPWEPEKKGMLSSSPGETHLEPTNSSASLKSEEVATPSYKRAMLPVATRSEKSSKNFAEQRTKMELQIKELQETLKLNLLEITSLKSQREQLKNINRDLQEAAAIQQQRKNSFAAQRSSSQGKRTRKDRRGEDNTPDPLDTTLTLGGSESPLSPDSGLLKKPSSRGRRFVDVRENQSAGEVPQPRDNSEASTDRDAPPQQQRTGRPATKPFAETKVENTTQQQGNREEPEDREGGEVEEDPVVMEVPVRGVTPEWCYGLLENRQALTADDNILWDTLPGHWFHLHNLLHQFVLETRKRVKLTTPLADASVYICDGPTRTIGDVHASMKFDIEALEGMIWMMQVTKSMPAAGAEAKRRMQEYQKKVNDLKMKLLDSKVTTAKELKKLNISDREALTKWRAQQMEAAEEIVAQMLAPVLPIEKAQQQMADKIAAAHPPVEPASRYHQQHSGGTPTPPYGRSRAESPSHPQGPFARGPRPGHSDTVQYLPMVPQHANYAAQRHQAEEASRLRQEAFRQARLAQYQGRQHDVPALAKLDDPADASKWAPLPGVGADLRRGSIRFNPPTTTARRPQQLFSEFKKKPTGAPQRPPQQQHQYGGGAYDQAKALTAREVLPPVVNYGEDKTSKMRKLTLYGPSVPNKGIYPRNIEYDTPLGTPNGPRF